MKFFIPIILICHQAVSADSNIREILTGKNRIENQSFALASLRMFKLARYVFDRTKWSKVDFRGLEARQVKFLNFVINDSNFAGAKFEDCHFENGSFVGVNFNAALFTDCTFRNVTLPSAIKKQAIFINVTFKKCYFQD